MLDFDKILARWQAALAPQFPRAAVAAYLDTEGPELRRVLEHASAVVRERRSTSAFHRWLDRQALAGREFDETQLRWLDMMRQDITASGALSIDGFNRDPFIARGGEDKAVRLFGRRTLGEVIASLNATLGSKASACGGTCGIKAGGCGCGCKGAGKPKPVETEDSTALEPGEYEAWLRRFEAELIDQGVASAQAPSIARRLAADTLRLYRKTPVNSDLYRLLIAEFAWLTDHGLNGTAIGVLASVALDLTMGPAATAAASNDPGGIGDILRMAGLELIEGSLFPLTTFTIYRPPSAEAHSQAMAALTRAGFPVSVHHDRIVIRHRSVWR